MRRKKQNIILLFTSLMIFNSCGFKHVKGIAPESSALTYNLNQIGYKEINDLVIMPNCIQCHSQSAHSGSIVLDSYVMLKANLGLVQNEVVGETMPPTGALPADQIQLISDWIQNGAPEFALQTPTPTPVPTATPVMTPTPITTPTPPTLVATYTSIRQNIFVPKCLSCHSSGSSQSSRPLDVYSKMMANSSLIQAGNPDNSGVYIEVSGGTMPPRNKNPVTDQEVAIIKAWIQNGAPQ